MTINLYVSTSGNDANNGTAFAPVATLARAQALVRAINGNMSQNIVVNIAGGFYPMAATLALTSADSATNGYTITWRGAGGENTVISGADLLTGWTQVDATKNIWQTAWTRSASPRALFAGDQRVYRSKGVLSAGTVSSTGYTSTSGALNGTRNPTFVEFAYCSAATSSEGFSFQLNRMVSVTSTTITMLTPAHTYITSSPNITGLTFPTFTSNVYEDFTGAAQRNSFYCDVANSLMNWIPAYGQTPNTTPIYAPNGLSESLINMTGVTGVNLDRLAFQHAHWSMSQGFAEDAQCFYRGNATPSPSDTPFNSLSPVEAVFISGCTNVNVTRCHFKHLTGSALVVRDLSSTCNITGNVITDISGVGISISDVSEASLSTCTDTVLCNNNHITYVGREFWGAPAIRTPYSSNLNVTQNYMRDGGYVAIGEGYSLNDYPSTRTKCVNLNITNNRIIGFNTRLQDGAAIYAQAANPTYLNITGNWISGVWTASGNSYAIYLDSGCTNVNLNSNVIDDVQSWVNTHGADGTHGIVFGTNYSTTTTHGADTTIPPYVDPTVYVSPATSIAGAVIAAAAGLQTEYKQLSFSPPRFADLVAAAAPLTRIRHNEASGTTADDYGSNATNGTYTSVTLVAPSMTVADIDTSGTYNGSSSYTNANASTPFNFTSAAGTPSDFTIFVIQNPNLTRSSYAEYDLVSKLDSNSPYSGFEYMDIYAATHNAPNNRTLQNLYLSNNFTSSRDGANSCRDLVNSRVWCTAVVFRGGFSVYNIKFYTNGLADGPTQYLNTLSASTSNSINVQFGARHGGSNFLGGNLGEVQMYDYALTDEQIYQLSMTANPSLDAWNNQPDMGLPGMTTDPNVVNFQSGEVFERNTVLAAANKVVVGATTYDSSGNAVAGTLPLGGGVRLLGHLRHL